MKIVLPVCYHLVTETGTVKHPINRKEVKVMKPIIFARIADMEYYRGITETDVPYSNSEYVKETGNAHECFNFDAISWDGEEVCLGFTMLIGNYGENGIRLRIENIIGCQGCKKEDFVDGVTVVWCATPRGGKTTRVVGFYKNATVYRYPQMMEFTDDSGETCYWQQYNFIAKKEDCVLLPRKERSTKSEWFIPASGKNGYKFGFGRSNVWFANSKDHVAGEAEFVEKMLNSIESYTGENLMDAEVK